MRKDSEQPDWDKALRDAAAPERPKKYAAATVAYEALVMHLIEVGIPEPKPFTFRMTALKVAAAGYQSSFHSHK
ncbi:MAG TPA: hypothetical protein VJ801_18020 [Polyangia bacterium]|nr:hypothetical protein [Polyangia bacterium]